MELLWALMAMMSLSLVALGVAGLFLGFVDIWLLSETRHIRDAEFVARAAAELRRD